MAIDDERGTSSPEHRPLPRVGIPLLREEIRAARLKRVLLALLVLVPVIVGSVSIGFYAGSSVFGPLGGLAWSTGRWPAVSALATGLLAAAFAVSLRLRATPPLAASRTSPALTHALST